MIIQTINGINIDFGDNAAVGFWKVDPGIPAIKEYFTTLGEITYPIYITFLILIILDIYFIRKNKCIKDK
jgi:hypothetical protein